MIEEDMISIIVPIYNVEKYLDRCIKSILNQTYKNLQIILVDDGSPDNCGKICDEYALKDKRIEVIHKENGGVSSARNIGLEKVKGKYIGFVDADDYISEDMYESMLNLIKNNDADTCICNLYIEENNSLSIKNKNIGNKIYNRMEILKEVILDKNIQSYPCNKLFKKELLKKIKFPEGKKYEDIGTTFYILENANKIIVTDKPYYYYYQRQDSTVNNVKEETIIDYIDIIDSRYDYISKKYDELKPYNIYYLTKTLITAYTDMYKLKHAKEETYSRILRLKEKVKKKYIKNEEKIIKLFDEKQKMELYTILYDENLYNKLIN